MTKKTTAKKTPAKTAKPPKAQAAKHANICRHVLIVKRKGHTEKFDGRKAYASAYFACQSAHLSEEESELIAQEVHKRLCDTLRTRKQATSQEIFEVISRELKRVHASSGEMYEKNRSKT